MYMVEFHFPLDIKNYKKIDKFCTCHVLVDLTSSQSLKIMTIKILQDTTLNVALD